MENRTIEIYIWQYRPSNHIMMIGNEAYRGRKKRAGDSGGEDPLSLIMVFMSLKSIHTLLPLTGRTGL